MKKVELSLGRIFLSPRGTLVEWKKAAVMKHNMGDSCLIPDELRRRTPEGLSN